MLWRTLKQGFVNNDIITPEETPMNLRHTLIILTIALLVVLPACDNQYVDKDGDGFSLSQDDCDDTNASVKPDGIERDCHDGLDNDCNDLVDRDDPNCVQDKDGDSYSLYTGDCDDNDPNTYVGAKELCDGVDNDCDGEIPNDEFLSMGIRRCELPHVGDDLVIVGS